ncbi:MAG: hypothetical protein ACLPSW_35140 [Roseiarcus sp.]
MPDNNPLLIFWSAPDDALFPSKDIACVRHVSTALLERERWERKGPKHLKVGNRVLYRKGDVLAWINAQAANAEAAA